VACQLRSARLCPRKRQSGVPGSLNLVSKGVDFRFCNINHLFTALSCIVLAIFLVLIGRHLPLIWKFLTISHSICIESTLTVPGTVSVFWRVDCWRSFKHVI